MLTSSAKAKGRRLQQYVRDKILSKFVELTINDVRSTSMGAQGTDIQLSELGQRVFPYAVECKAHEGYGKLYSAYQQANDNRKYDLMPVLVIRSNHQKALVVMDFEDFLTNVTRKN